MENKRRETRNWGEGDPCECSGQKSHLEHNRRWEKPLSSRSQCSIIVRGVDLKMSSKMQKRTTKRSCGPHFILQVSFMNCCFPVAVSSLAWKLLRPWMSYYSVLLVMESSISHSSLQAGSLLSSSLLWISGNLLSWNTLYLPYIHLVKTSQTSGLTMPRVPILSMLSLV